VDTIIIFILIIIIADIQHSVLGPWSSH